MWSLLGATVAGGQENIASGENATVPGGDNNLAQGTRSFAAGHQAKAYNQGCFVWGDSTADEVPCNVDNRWVAGGGVYFYSDGGLSNGVYVAAGGNSWNGESDTAINMQDADGVALAAIQALYGQVQTLQAENADLESRVAALEAAAGSGGSARPWKWGLLPGLGLLTFGLVWVARRGGDR